MRAIRVDWIWAVVLLVWTLPPLVWFYRAVAEPALERRSDVKVGADSLIYVDTARFLQSTGNFTADNVVSLEFNYFGPVLLLMLSDYNHALIALLNYLLLLLGIAVLARHYNFHRFWYVFLLVVNPITLLSVTAVNKEILGLTGVIFLMAYLRSGLLWHLLLALLLAMMTRWQQVAFIAILLPYLAWLKQDQRMLKWGPLVALGGASALYPFVHPYFDFAGDTSATNIRNQFAQAGGLVPFLNDLQARGLYWLVFIPKALLNYVGNFPRVVRVFDPLDSADFYNRVLVGHQLAMLLVLALLAWKRRIDLRSLEFQVIFVYTVLYTISLALSYRYYYPIYPLFLLLLTSRETVGVWAVQNWRPRVRLRWRAQET